MSTDVDMRLNRPGPAAPVGREADNCQVSVPATSQPPSFVGMVLPTNGPLPWEPPNRRSPLRDLALPHLAGALRRLTHVKVPERNRIPILRGEGRKPNYPYDFDVVDNTPTRVLGHRVRHAISWNNLHPPRTVPYVYNLSHACLLTHACGIQPTRFMQLAHHVGVDARHGDEVLFEVAYLATICDFPIDLMGSLITKNAWTPQALAGWATRHSHAHFEAALDAGWNESELGALAAVGQEPDPEQVELMAAFGLAAPVAG